MGAAESLDKAAEKSGVEILYMKEGIDPLPFYALFDDFGLGFVPKGIDPRFTRNISRWASFMFSAYHLPSEPDSKDTIKVNDVVYIVRQFEPTCVKGKAEIYEVFANTEQKRS
ncbi:hypothetical protein [Maridesulfovibrio ferrireducens]|uniref:hypothetical protein n=1 Tax=Maridesulfovibrio ferrireducens TaxID=246191 RepID=UPI001A2EB906|nr:hypothetical protein [Maridesulfovibrio ferrireducens]MBI9110000.1 hypothetical protein [Maridesulfovibrio ferrireducens]